MCVFYFSIFDTLKHLLFVYTIVTFFHFTLIVPIIINTIWPILSYQCSSAMTSLKSQIANYKNWQIKFPKHAFWIKIIYLFSDFIQCVWFQRFSASDKQFWFFFWNSLYFSFSWLLDSPRNSEYFSCKFFSN